MENYNKRDLEETSLRLPLLCVGIKTQNNKFRIKRMGQKLISTLITRNIGHSKLAKEHVIYIET